MRSMVEGLFGTSVENMLENALYILLHLAGGNPEHTEAPIPQPFVAPLVARRIVAHPMRDAVDLDGQLCGRAIEIQHEWPGRMLATKLEVDRMRPKQVPELRFRWRHGAAKGSGFLDRRFAGLPQFAPPPHFMRSPSPSPSATGRTDDDLT